MARSGPVAPGFGRVLICLVVALLLGGCGVAEEFPTPTPTTEVSPTPTQTPSPTSTSVSTPENTTPVATPTSATTAVPSPLSLRPTATTPPSPTSSTTPTPSNSDQTVPATTATAPGPGPVATVAVVQPGATSTIPIATIEPTVVPEPTSTPTFVPEPTATPTPTPTLIPEPTPTPDLCPGAIPWYDAINYLGAYATVIGPVVSAFWAQEEQGKPTFLNLGAAYPDPGRFTVLIWIDGRWNFDFAPEEVYLGSTVCVTGTITLYEGSAEMEIMGPEWIWVP